MSIPTYQVFNVNKENPDTCARGESGYLPRTNYILDSFRNREITNGESVKDEGERQYDGAYNMSQRARQQQQQQQQQQNPVSYTEGFYNFKSVSLALIIISVSSLFVFLYILYKIIKGRNKKIDFQEQHFL